MILISSTAVLPLVNGRHRNRALAAARRAPAIQLAPEGRTYQDIADELGYANRGTVHHIVHQALHVTASDAVKNHQQLELARLDALQVALWDQAMAGDVDAARGTRGTRDTRGTRHDPWRGSGSSGLPRKSSNWAAGPRRRWSSRLRTGKHLDCESLPLHAMLHASALGLLVEHMNLNDQFRCGGSEIYVDWVLRLLGLVPGGPVKWAGDDGFSVSVVDTPQELEHLLASRQGDGYSARMAAGYCWPWSNPTDDGSLVPGVVIDAWSHP